MKSPRHTRRPSHNRSARKGGATVEFAIIAPLFLTLMLGTIEMSNAIDATNKMTSAVREGGRLASMDASQILTAGQTANEKVILDIQNFLKANGMPGDDITITIVEADSDTEFDLSDTANYLEIFRIKAEVPYADVSLFPVRHMTGATLQASMAYRMGRVTMVE